MARKTDRRLTRWLDATKDSFRYADCAILANGPSLLEHSPERFPDGTLTIGVNRSWERFWADFHVTLELDQWERFPGIYRELARQERLVVLGDWPVGACLRIYPPPHRKSTPFSTDLHAGAVESLDGVGSATYVALQLAYWLGCPTVRVYGLDLGLYAGRTHFYPRVEPSNAARFAMQKRLYSEARIAFTKAGRRLVAVEPTGAGDVLETEKHP